MMKAQGAGRIVNVTALGGKTPGAGSVPTSVSRAAGIALTKAMSKDYAKYNILVNNVLPGRIITNRIIELAEKKAKETGKPIEMVLDSMGLPLRRIRESTEKGQVEEWIYGERPRKIIFVKFQEGVVISIKEY